jgi:hypothetical protein
VLLAGQFHDEEKLIDPTIVLTVIRIVVLFRGWLVLPRFATIKPSVIGEERHPVTLSA